MIPEVSAGSNQVGASEICAPQINCPCGAASAQQVNVKIGVSYFSQVNSKAGQGQKIVLVSASGRRVGAVYETSDTLRVYFSVGRRKRVAFRQLRDGSLQAGKRWTIDGEPRNSRAVIDDTPGRT